MKEKLANFFKKLNNSYIVAAICVILIGVIVLGAMISLVAHPFATNTTYSAKVKEDVLGATVVVKSKLVLLDDGRYSLTVKSNLVNGRTTTFGDYAYGRIKLSGEGHHNVIWFDGDTSTMVEQKNPFKLEFDGVVFTNVGGILWLVFYCFVIVIVAAIATILLIKRKDGNVVFTSKIRLIKRLREIEDMLGVRHE